MSEQLHTDFREFLELLLENEVRFLVVGGYAVSWHGRPRNTDDIDLWIDRSEDNAMKVLKSLQDFGAADRDTPFEPFTRENQIVHLGRKPWQIDLLTHIPGVTFDSCFERRVFWEVEGRKFPMISLEDLKANKVASARPKDLIDLNDHLSD